MAEQILVPLPMNSVLQPITRSRITTLFVINVPVVTTVD